MTILSLPFPTVMLWQIIILFHNTTQQSNTLMMWLIITRVQFSGLVIWNISYIYSRTFFCVKMNPDKFEIKVKIIPEKVPSKTPCRKIQIITISIIQPQTRNSSLFLRDWQHLIVLNNNDCEKLKVTVYKLKKNPQNISPLSALILNKT